MGDTCLPQPKDGNVGLAFGLVTAAGLSTTIGAALAFVMPYSASGKNLFLAASLGIAAGVMTYVSFVEIFATKTIEAFNACVPDRFAYLYATLCFFGGAFITYIFDCLLHIVERRVLGPKKRTKATATVSSTDGSSHPIAHNASTRGVDETPIAETHRAPPTDVERQMMTDDAIVATHGDHITIDNEVGHDGHMIAEVYRDAEHDPSKLIRMGIFAGLALAFHNFPEGLATFVSVLEDPSVGASVAVAIGVHNIPEGICVAMPIYYATGSRWKAFMWATLSGMTELVGALLGWAVLRNVITEAVYGVLFGVVSGMMVYISLKELLPTAHRYDPADKVTTFSLVFGMVVIALSLVLFQF